MRARAFDAPGFSYYDVTTNTKSVYFLTSDIRYFTGMGSRFLPARPYALVLVKQQFRTNALLSISSNPPCLPDAIPIFNYTRLYVPLIR